MPTHAPQHDGAPGSQPCRFPIIAGPTAGGKTDLAVRVAVHARQRWGLTAEVLTADSMQVYRHLDIGTAKPTLAERAGIPHHLVDVAEPTESFSVDRWLGLARAAIEEVRGRGGVPIVVGGTHLYIKALLDGLFEGPPPDPDRRARLAAMDPADRRALLERADPQAAARIHPADQRRTVRALEVLEATGVPITRLQTQWDRPSAASDRVLVILDWPADRLARRINARVRDMMRAGLLEEVRELLRAGRLGDQARQALGYKQLADYLEAGPHGADAGARDGERLAAAVEAIKTQTRRLAKSQRTWLRRLGARPGCLRLDMADLTPDQAAERVLDAMRAPAPELKFLPPTSPSPRPPCEG
ncbi:MAG TPA: tRNA (adenosine(37)-N6)-dimethylallyltransferase MiaA [Phycisphaerales bacterium]|nr:tRNA (adenosine(37)-N6)-dimethylallyltransferase MiaA [Phycisphaerales bacterium]